MAFPRLETIGQAGTAGYIQPTILRPVYKKSLKYWGAHKGIPHTAARRIGRGVQGVRINRSDGETDAFQFSSYYVLLSLLLVQSYSQPFYVRPKKKLYTRCVMGRKSPLRVRDDAILHQSLHPSSVKQMAFPMILLCHCVSSVRYFPTNKMKGAFSVTECRSIVQSEHPSQGTEFLLLSGSARCTKSVDIHIS